MATQPSTPDARMFQPMDTRYGLRGLAELAFGSLTQADELAQGQHLALLQAESLELDLSDSAQRRFGDYELLELLGEGGMGAVYRARHVPLDREVAVKLLSAGPWASKDFIARFEREAQNAARMQHPNIVTVYEAGSHDGLYFFSMRLVEGHSLSALLKRGEHYTYRQAATLLRTVAEAVAYAHSLGVLHLDLKPGNVLIDGDSVPHVADFGLARRLDSAAMVANDEVSGTPSYMAPEQAQLRSSRLTAATDVWGLGAILYELLTGVPPFRGETAQATLKLVQEGQVRVPRRVRPDLPLDLQAIVLKCLTRDPGERYPSARALADDLARFIEGRPVQARPLNAAQKVWRWARREPKLASTLACAVAALVIGLIATGWQWHRAKHNAVLAQDNSTIAQQTLWKSRTATAQKQMEQGDAYAALANVLANLHGMEARGDRADAALARLRIGTVLANAPRLIDVIPMGNDQITDLAISPDAKTIAAVTDSRTVHLIDVASAKQLWSVKVGVNSFGMSGGDVNQGALYLHFSGDGQRLVGYGGTGIDEAFASVLSPHRIDSVMIDVANGKLVDPPRQFPDFLAASFSDDGRYALLFDRHGDVQRWRTQPWSPAGDKVDIKGDIDNRALAGPLLGEALLSDDGATMVLVSDANLEFRAFDARRMRSLHTFALGTSQGRATAWALRHDGRQLAIGTMSGQTALWDLDTGAVAWLPSGMNGFIANMRYSADDSRLAMVSNEPNEFRVFDPRSRELVATPVSLDNAMNPGTPNEVEFGPDAATVLTRHAPTNATLWRIPEAGYPPQAPVAAAPLMVANQSRFALASDARSRLMATSDNGRLKLWRVRWSPLIGGTAAPMVSDTLRFDGRHLVSAEGNRVSVFDVATDRNVGKAIALSEAPTFAGLDGSGTRLIAITGREISCWNWLDGKPCWPTITLPDSPLRLGLAAHAPMLAVSTGSNKDRRFFEQVRLIDLATGRQRGAPITLRGPLGALRLSEDGRRLLAFEHHDTIADDSNVVRVIDTDSAKIVQNLAHDGKPRAHIIDARFADDGSVWSLSGPPAWGGDQKILLRHWGANGKLLDKTEPEDDDEFGIWPLPHGRGVIETDHATVFDQSGIARKKLTVPDDTNRVNVSALSPDGKLLALADLDGVSLFVIDRNQRLAPDFKLALPNHDAIQQLAFAPDGSRLVGRTLSGHWFQWRIASDTRPVAAIAEDLRLRDFTDQGLSDKDKSVPPLPAAERRKLRAADPGPMPVPSPATVVNANVTAPVSDARYEPLNLDAIANVDPRAPMNRATRVPPQPQSLPTLPRGLQRYGGVDFLLGRAVQLSGTPRNRLDTAFPARSPPLSIAPQRIAAVDALVFQFNGATGAVGAVRLHYADGGERDLAILDDRDTYSMMDLRAIQRPDKPPIGWLGTYSTDLRGWGMGDSGAAAAVPANVVRLENPEPDRPVTAISLEAPPNASPGLLFLALTLEPSRPDRAVVKTPP